MRNVSVAYQLSAALVVYQTHIFQGKALAARNLAFLLSVLEFF